MYNNCKIVRIAKVAKVLIFYSKAIAYNDILQNKSLFLRNLT